MYSEKQRSSLFKFFYIVLRIITFPIYVLIYILKHPLWVLLFIVLGLAGLAYYPMSKGVHSSDIVEWYKNKYSEVKYDVIKSVAEKVDEGFVPASLVEEVKKEQQKIEEEKEEEKRFKGENYNVKVSRQDEFEDVAVTIKKRGGFKKKTVEKQEEDIQNTDSSEKAGGLSGILKKIETKNEELAKEIKDEVVEDTSTVEEAISENLDNPKEDVSIEEVVSETKEKVVPASENDAKDTKESEEFDELDLF